MAKCDNDELEYNIAQLIKFYNGGITYNDFMNMSIPKIYRFAKHAKKINDEEKRAYDNARY